MKRFLRLMTLSAFIMFGARAVFAACYDGACVTDSADTTPIEYHVSGSGDITLVFIHGWSCDSRYWRMQVPYFEGRYRVVTVDLAGHGHSGMTRTDYTVKLLNLLEPAGRVWYSLCC